VESYEKDLSASFELTKSYVRYRRPTQVELKEAVEYVLDAEDEAWLQGNTKFGGASAPNQKKRMVDDSEETAHPQNSGSLSSSSSSRPDLPSTVKLPSGILEIIMDVLETATAFDAIITMDQAEFLILKRLPQLYHLYPTKAKAGVVTLKHVLNDIYNYWVSKRSKLKRPLLRRFWPLTSSDDTNPHLVFRPREKEKYKLRKKRQNDMDAHRKLLQLKHDFEHLRALLGLVRRREELNRNLVRLQTEWFQQKIYDAIDTSGLPRVSTELRRNEIDEISNIPTHFEAPAGWKKNKKSRRGSATGQSSRSTSPVPDAGTRADNSASAFGGGGTTAESMPMVVAGQNHGEPAPLFVHPLNTRETYATSWDRAVPHVTTYENSHPTPTFRFRHRPRVGRGGRLCIDRMPHPPNPDFTPTTVFTAGIGLPRSLQPKERLLDLLPRPLDHDALSRKIEAICLNALKEDYEMVGKSTPANTGVIEGDENDGDEVVVKVDDWLDTDDQLWGEERFSIGPF
jgi:enhancer of polycomb-like protein